MVERHRHTRRGTPHRLAGHGARWLSDPARGRPGLEQQMSYYRDFLDWATQGKKVPVIESTWQVARGAPARRGRRHRDQLGRQSHRQHHLGRLHVCRSGRLGDGLGPARAGPGLVALLRPAVLRGPRCRPAGGFGSHEDTIERYSELMGRPMRDIFFYEIFSGFRFAVVMYRLSDLVFGREDMEQDAGMATNNIATQLLAKMLELDPPT